MWYQTLKQNLVTNFSLHKKLYFIFGALFSIIILFLIAIALTTNTPSSTNQTQTESPNSGNNINTSTTQTNGSLSVNAPVRAGFIFSYDNRVYYTPATITNVPVGSYTLTVHNDGYADETVNVTVKNDKKTNVMLTMKELTLDEHLSQVEGDWIPYFDAEAEKINQEILEREKKYPFTKELPQVFGNVMLDYDVNDNGSVTYVVRPLIGKTYNRADYEQSINTFIQSNGLEPNTINLVWKE